MFFGTIVASSEPVVINKEVDLPRVTLERTRKGWHWVTPTLARMAVMAGLGGVGTFLYATQLEPRWTQWRAQTIALDRLPRAFDGYRIILLADLHLAEGKLLDRAALQRVIRRINRMQPDMVLIGGDLVSRVDAESLAGIRDLGQLRAHDGVFGVPGNHDYWTSFEQVQQAVESANVRMLVNESHTVRRGGASLVIAGVDDIWEGVPNLDKALRGVPSDAAVVLMAHESNYADIAAHDRRVGLQVSGHSHGGQIRIPWAGPLVLPDMAWHYPMGLYEIKRPDHRLWVYTNRGIGLAEMPVRFFCRPEVTIFTLRA